MSDQTWLFSPYRLPRPDWGSCEPKLCQNTTEWMMMVSCKYRAHAKHRSTSCQSRSSYENIAQLSRETFLKVMDIGFDYDTNFRVLPNVRSISWQRTNFKLNVFFQNMLILSSCASGFQKCNLFWRTTIIDVKKRFKKWRLQLFFSRSLHRQIKTLV